MARQAAAPAPQHAAEPGVIAGAFLGIVKVLGWLVLGLVFSILVEWLGMSVFWPEEGTRTAGGCWRPSSGISRGVCPGVS